MRPASGRDLVQRRATFEILVLVVLGTTAVWVGSPAGATAADSGRPEFAAPHVGDRAEYAEEVRAAPAAVGRLRFEWAGGETFPDGAGVPHGAVALEAATGDVASGTPARPVRFHLDVQDSSLLAVTERREARQGQASDLAAAHVPTDWADANVETTTFRRAGDAGPLPPCAAVAIPARATPTPDGRLRLAPRCSIGAWSSPDAGLVAAWPRTHGAGDLLGFETAQGARLWFDPTIPYPVVLETPAAPDGTRVRQALVGNERGTHDWPHPSAPPGAEPVLRWGSAEPWGADEVGIHHPFPLSQAYAYARDDPTNSTLRDFVAAHPASGLTASEYYESVSNSTGLIARIWHFDVSDGRDVLRTCLVRDGRVPGRNAADLGPVELQTYTYTGCREGDAAPVPSRPPARVPTAASMQEAWSARAALLGLAPPPNEWGLATECDVPACHAPRILFHAGFEVRYYDWALADRPEAPLSTAGTTTAGRMYVDPTGWSDRISVMVVSFGQDIVKNPVEPVHRRDDGGYQLSAPARLGHGWDPLAASAVAAAVATVLAAAYLFWIPFYTRLVPERVLAHPRRVQILDYLETDPGAEANAVARRLQMPSAKARYHIEVLRRSGHVLARRLDGRTSLFPASPRFFGKEEQVALLRRDAFRRAYAALVDRPGLDQTALGAALGLGQSRVSKVLARLERAGLVRGERHGPRNVYTAVVPDPTASATP